MAKISATPNPAGVYSATVGAAITIDWDTELRGVSGIVKVLRNGTIDEPVSGQSPARSGRVSHNVKTPNTYRVALLRSDTRAELASILVTTFDLRQQLAAGFSQAYNPQLRPQMITNLVVRPGIDTVSISFRTTRPTIPTTELRDENGVWVDGRLPLFGGLQTRHEAVFGIERPLALNKKHTFKIEAFGGTNNKASPGKAVVTGEFMTGRRHVDVSWETLDIHDDSDPWDEGEFYISFGVGDVETKALLGDPGWLIGADISEDDPPISLGNTMSLTDASRKLWLQFIAADNDQTLGIAATIDPPGLWPTYSEPGSRFRSAADEERATVTIHVDVDTDPGRHMIPFELRASDGPVGYAVTGHIGVHAFVGSYVSAKVGKLARLPDATTVLSEPGSIGTLAIGGVGGRTEIVALGHDGTLYHRPFETEGSRRADFSGWTRIALPGRGTPTAIATTEGMLEIIDLNDDGSVIHCRLDTQNAKPSRWRKLGGKFREIRAAVGAGKIRKAEPQVFLFGIAEDGSLHVRDANSDKQEWDRLGDRRIRAIAPVAARGTGASLFAVDDAGALLHFSRRNGRWRSDSLANRLRGKPAVQLLTAAVVDQQDGGNNRAVRCDLVVAAMFEDYHVETIRWSDYPNGAPNPRWENAGPVQDLLVWGNVDEQARSRSGRRSRTAVAA